MPTLKDRIMGCLVGGAIGDCIGGTLSPSPDDCNFKIPENASISDDTQLTLATCEGIVEASIVDPQTISSVFLKWFRRKKLSGLGSSTLEALQNLSSGIHWSVAGSRGERAKGNGAAMRIAPVAFIIDPLASEGKKTIRHICSVTHREEEAYIGALSVAIAISIEGFDFMPLLLDHLPDSLLKDRLRLLYHYETLSIKELADSYGKGGYVVESVPIALIAAQRAKEKDFREALFDALSCGGDSDTIGSMVGQIVGSKIGFSAIPDDFRSIDLGPEPVLSMASRFADFVCTFRR